MSVFIDTSALLAVFDRRDDNHAAADTRWRALVAGDDALLTTNYVVLETFALLQRRLGLDAVRTFVRDVLPVLVVRWIGEREHDSAMAAVLSSGRRRLSVVDCVSFDMMKDLGVRRCFAFDAHFREQGFDPDR